jgi:hypothetical protein
MNTTTTVIETSQKQYTCTFIDRLSNTTTTVLETPQKQYTGTFIDRLSNTTTTVLETPQKQYTTTFIDRLSNSLPQNIRHVQSVSIFKKLLKTHLFRAAYGDSI